MGPSERSNAVRYAYGDDSIQHVVALFGPAMFDDLAQL